jgi:hypothetical protein
MVKSPHNSLFIADLTEAVSMAAYELNQPVAGGCQGHALEHVEHLLAAKLTVGLDRTHKLERDGGDEEHNDD